MIMAAARLRALRNHISMTPGSPLARGRPAASRCLSSSTVWQPPTAEDVAKYNDEGFLIVKGVLNPQEVELVTEAILQNEAIVSLSLSLSVALARSVRARARVHRHSLRLRATHQLLDGVR